MKLETLTDFVTKQEKYIKDNTFIYESLKSILHYNNFLKQELNLSMFIPCDKHMNPLNEPKNYSAFEVGMSGKDFHFNFIDCQEYKEALENILFYGWELVHNGKWGAEIARDRITGNNQINITKYLNIEKLLNEKQLFLTESAIKKLGLWKQ